VKGRVALRRRFRSFIALFVLLSVAAPARAEEQLKIGIGFGLAFLPTYICEDLKLVEKYGKEQRLTIKATYERLLSAAAVHDAIASRAIDMGPFPA
jgi:NitT/TauT family transport system substrate-binding protein